MNSIDQLQRDHQRFRNALQTLEEALGAGETERLVPLCALLSERLRAHIRAEGQMAVWCSRVVGRFGPEVLARLAIEHYPEQQYLQVLRRGLRRTPLASLEHLRTPAKALLSEFRRHMDEQEASLFPFIEQVCWWRRAVVDASRPAVPRRWTPRIALLCGRGRGHFIPLKSVELREAGVVVP